MIGKIRASNVVGSLVPGTGRGRMPGLMLVVASALAMSTPAVADQALAKQLAPENEAHEVGVSHTSIRWSHAAPFRKGSQFFRSSAARSLDTTRPSARINRARGGSAASSLTRPLNAPITDQAAVFIISRRITGWNSR